MEVSGRNSIVGSLMVVVIFRNAHFRAFETLVEHSHLKSDAQFSAKKFHLVGNLRSDIEVGEKSQTFLLHHHTNTKTLAKKLERHVGRRKEGVRRIGNTQPLQAGAAGDVDEIRSADSRRIIIGRQSPILRQLSVELCRSLAAAQCHQHQRQYCKG